MKVEECHENYPTWIPITSNLMSISIYLIGAFIIAGFGILWALLYIGYCVFVELMVLKRSCVQCYYYGKICAFGKGRLCSILFKQGDPKKFAEKEIKWYSLLPDFMVTIIPIVVGIIFLVLFFNWIVLILIIVQFLLGTVGTAIVRGSLACNHCKQGELGCPAAKAFFKDKTEIE